MAIPTAAHTIRVLAQAASLATGTHSLDGLLAPILRLAAEQLGLEHATLCIYDPDNDTLLIEAAHGLSADEVQRLQDQQGGGSRDVIASGAPLLVSDITRDPRFDVHVTAIPGGMHRTAVCVPVMAGDDVIGTLSAFRPSTRTFTLRDDMRALTVFATLLAPAIADQVGHSIGGLSAGQPATFTPHGLAGRSKLMREVFELVGQVSTTETPVLLLGERGTGKQRVAEAIHHHSRRHSGPLVKVNCTALPISRVASELFGHEPGAFIDAQRMKRGRLQLAQGGTLFLDEIADLPLSVQARLVRAIDDGTFEREGSSRQLPTDTRIVAASTRDLQGLISTGEVVGELAATLGVFPIRVPPLRERSSDVLLLADHFIELFNAQHRREVKRLATSAIDMLTAYHWPGNVRELEGCIERAVLIARGDVILGSHLPPTLQTAESSGTGLRGGLASQMSRVEKEIILDALKSSRGNMAEAARKLQITERIMGLRVAKYGIDPRRFKSWR